MTEFMIDTLRVLGRFIATLANYAHDCGFVRQEFYILRGDQRAIFVWSAGEPMPTPPVRLKPVKIVLPGWSQLTRLPHIRETEVRYPWF